MVKDVKKGSKGWYGSKLMEEEEDKEYLKEDEDVGVVCGMWLLV